MPRTFRSEEERLKALTELPDFPPKGEDVDAFNARIDRERDEIMEAEIVTGDAALSDSSQSQEPKSQESSAEPAPEPKPEPSPQPQSQPQEPKPEPKPATEPQPSPAPAVEPVRPRELSDDDVMFVVNEKPVLRRDLPEELRKYTTPEEVIKQFGHARNYANTAEERLKALIAERDQLKSRLEQPPASQPQMGSQPQPPSESPPVAREPQPQSQPVQPDDKDVDELLEQIGGIEDDTIAEDTLGGIKTVFSKMAEAVKSSRAQARQLDKRFAQYRQESEKMVHGLRGRLDQRDQTEKEREAQQEQMRAQRQVADEIAALQGACEELKTSKPVFNMPGVVQQRTVEDDAWQFADKILMARSGRTAQNFAEVASIIDAWNREEPELRAFAQNNGITPELVGSSDLELLNLATLYNVYNAMRGQQFNPTTGQLQQMLAPNQRPVNFPTAVSAYRYLLDMNGVTEARRRQELAAVEQRGQQAVLSAMERGTQQANVIGRDGSASPENVGQEMSEEAALEILGHRPGSRTIDEFEMERQALAGDRSLYKLHCQAQKRLGLPEAQPSADWPPELVPQPVA